MKQIRTDLAMESQRAAGDMPGVDVRQWDSMGIAITEVKIENELAAARLNKPMGIYITLECPGIKKRELQSRIAAGNILAEEIARLLPEGDAPVMVIGLGNRGVTPDSLGPKTIDGTLVTRHLFTELPHAVDERMNNVCAISPGVMGVTGIETMETIDGLVKQVAPRAVVVVDSLAARGADRLGTTVQITDSGIQPGSGVGNHRRALTQRELGVKVIAIGVPTVVYAATIVMDAIELISDSDGASAEVERALFEGELGEMIVTPREIDSLIEDAAQVLSTGLNRALHGELSDSEIRELMS